MGLFERVNRLVNANLNDLIAKAEDPNKSLNLELIEMQETLAQMRQSIAQLNAAKKHTELQYNQANSQANQWQSRAELAFRKGDEALAREALERKIPYKISAEKSKKKLEGITNQLESLTCIFNKLENKIIELKDKINFLEKRKKTTSNQQLENLLDGINSHSHLTAFERMEQKVLEWEKSSNINSSISFFTESDDQRAEDILEKAIQETEALINQGIVSKEDLKKQLIEQETTLQILQQHLRTLKQLKEKLDFDYLISSNSPNSGIAHSSSSTPTDDELEQLRQELKKM